MPFDAPFQLGPFMIDPSGSLMPPADRGARFSLRWHGCLVRAAMHPVHGDLPEGGVELELQAVLGRVPSSAAAGGTGREAVFATLRALSAEMPSGITVGLSADHCVTLQETRNLGPRLTISVLVTEVASFVLDAAPYLDLAAESGVTPAGTVKT